MRKCFRPFYQVSGKPLRNVESGELAHIMFLGSGERKVAWIHPRKEMLDTYSAKLQGYIVGLLPHKIVKFRGYIGQPAYYNDLESERDLSKVLC